MTIEMDPVVEMKHLMVRNLQSKEAFGDDRASELRDSAYKFSESARILKLHCLELAIQFEAEFPGESTDMFDQAKRWVERTAEEHHPNNPTLWLKALMFVLKTRRGMMN